MSVDERVARMKKKAEALADEAAALHGLAPRAALVESETADPSSPTDSLPPDIPSS